MLEAFIEHVEGSTKLLVPRGSLRKGGVPPKKPAFYNPLAKPTRDLSVLFYEALSEYEGGKRYLMLDVLAGVGARGLRVINETNALQELHLNDANPLAIEAARVSSKLNGVEQECRFYVEDANVLMYSLSKQGVRYDIVDVDPFGPPVRFIDAALSSVRRDGILAVTATDTSALSGVYPNSARRKYFGLSYKTDFHLEVSIRLLISMVAMRAASLEKFIKPVFSHATSQYVRVYLRVGSSATKADEMLDSLGYLRYCPACLFRGLYELGGSSECPNCGRRTRILGPLWVNPIADKRIVGLMIQGSERRGWRDHARVLRRLVSEPEDVFFYYSLVELAKHLNTNVLSPETVVNKLREKGYEASRSWLDPQAVKTNAPLELIKAIIKEPGAG